MKKADSAIAVANSCLTSGDCQKLENNLMNQGRNGNCVGNLRSSSSNRVSPSFLRRWDKFDNSKKNVSWTLCCPSNTGVISSNGV